MKSKNKNTVSRYILERLAELGEVALEGLLPRGRTDTRLWRVVLGLDTGRSLSRKNFSATLSQLKQQGLVRRSGPKRYSRWRLTKQGKAKLVADLIELPKEDGVPRLVFFDIPEKERSKRNWLRGELAACGYQRLQLSVWLGYCPLPASFFKTIDRLNLKGRVHVVSINKTGTLKLSKYLLPK